MDIWEAARLRERWGDRLCNHPATERETWNGSKTGDRVCTQCGESFAPEEVEQRRQEGRD